MQRAHCVGWAQPRHGTPVDYGRARFPINLPTDFNFSLKCCSLRRPCCHASATVTQCCHDSRAPCSSAQHHVPCRGRGRCSATATVASCCRDHLFWLSPPWTNIVVSVRACAAIYELLAAVTATRALRELRCPVVLVGERKCPTDALPQIGRAHV